MQLHRVSELLGGGIGVAGRERGLSDGTRQGGEGIAVAGLRGDPRERRGAGLRLGKVALPTEVGGAEAQTLDGVVMVLAAFPEGEQRAEALPGLLGVALDRGHPREPGDGVHRHVVVAHVGGGGERGREHPPGGAQLPLSGVDHPDECPPRPKSRCPIRSSPRPSFSASAHSPHSRST